MDENLELKISDFGFSAKVTEEDKLTGEYDVDSVWCF